MASASFIVALSALASLATFPTLKGGATGAGKKPGNAARPIHGSQFIGAMVYDEKHCFIGAIEDVVFTLATKTDPARARAILRVCDRQTATSKRTIVDFSKLKVSAGGAFTVSVKDGLRLRSVLIEKAA